MIMSVGWLIICGWGDICWKISVMGKIIKIVFKFVIVVICMLNVKIDYNIV